MVKVLSDQQVIDVCEAYKKGDNSVTLGRKYGVSATAIRGLLIRRGITMRKQSETKRKYKVNQNYFGDIDSEDKAYFLGLLFADGYILKRKNRIILQLTDKEIIEEFRRYLESDLPIKPIRLKVGKLQHRILIVSEKMRMDLENLGLYQAKSFTCRVPHLNANFNNHFVRGYFDGDGSVSPDSRKGYKSKLFVSLWGNEDFLKDIISILPFKYKSKISFKGRTGYLRFGWKSASQFLDWVYRDAHVYLDRKKEVYNASCNIRDRFIAQGVYGPLSENHLDMPPG